MKRRAAQGLFIFILTSLFFCAPATRIAAAQESHASRPPLKVGILPQDRFVERNADGSYTGFEVDLWESIAKAVGLEFRFVQIQPFSKLLDEIADGHIDIGIATITMDHERADYISFTHPYFVSSLGILARAQGQRTVLSVLYPLFRPIIGKMLLLFVFAMFIFGNILWATERGKHSIISRHYFPGIFQAMWCTFAIQSTIGFGDIIPNQWVARLLAIPIWICGLFLVAIITAQLLAAYTSEQLISPIHSYKDLRGRSVGVIEGTVAAEVVDGLGVKKVFEVPGNLKGLYARVERGEIDAVVADYPSLADLAAELRAQGKKPYLAPQHFYQEMYSFAINRKLAEANPKLLEQINLQILTLRDNGYLDHLKNKWFADLGLH